MGAPEADGPRQTGLTRGLLIAPITGRTGETAGGAGGRFLIHNDRRPLAQPFGLSGNVQRHLDTITRLNISCITFRNQRLARPTIETAAIAQLETADHITSVVLAGTDDASITSRSVVHNFAFASNRRFARQATT
jgi:hypothetical protein